MVQTSVSASVTTRKEKLKQFNPPLTKSKKAQGVHSTTKFEKKDISRPAQSTKTCHAIFSLAVSSHHLHLLSRQGPSTVREGTSCRGSRPLGCITQQPGLMHFLAQHVQGHVTTQSHLCQLPVLQEKRDLATRPMQLDNVQRIVAHIAFTRAAGGHTFVFRPSFAFTLPHWTLLGSPLSIRPPKSRT